MHTTLIRTKSLQTPNLGISNTVLKKDNLDLQFLVVKSFRGLIVYLMHDQERKVLKTCICFHCDGSAWF